MKRETNLIRKIYRHETLHRVERKINLLGSNVNYNVIDLLNYRLITSLLILFVIVIMFPGILITAPIIFLIYYKGIEYLFLDLRIKKRTRKLNKEAPQFFEVLALCLENTGNLSEALLITTDSLKGEITTEFKRVLNETEYGKSFTESLQDMKKRIPSDSINNIIRNIIDSDTLGSNITNTLYNEIEYLQEKEFSELKSRIAKVPIKVSIISVIFFIPILLLIILSPVIINLMIG